MCANYPSASATRCIQMFHFDEAMFELKCLILTSKFILKKLRSIVDRQSVKCQVSKFQVSRVKVSVLKINVEIKRTLLKPDHELNFLNKVSFLHVLP